MGKIRLPDHLVKASLDKIEDCLSRARDAAERGPNYHEADCAYIFMQLQRVKSFAEYEIARFEPWVTPKGAEVAGLRLDKDDEEIKLSDEKTD